MSKYEILYGVTVDHFPNEEENIKEKLRLASERLAGFHLTPPKDFDEKMIEHELKQAVFWCEKILNDIRS